jgi:hypothetical protein
VADGPKALFLAVERLGSKASLEENVRRGKWTEV